MTGERHDPRHPRYYFDLLNLYRVGIGRKRKRLRLEGRRVVELHDCCNIDIGPDLGPNRREKPWGAAPNDVEAYLQLLENVVRRVIDNANAPERQRKRYRPVAMISRGYDSSAVAAIARKVGCREAVTFLRSDSPREKRYADDSGKAIAELLGYDRIDTFERNDAFRHPEFRAEEFYVEPWGADRGNVVMADRLAGSLLLSGRSGEAIWTRGQRFRRGLPDFRYPSDMLAGCALGEFRMRMGFLHFAPATIALYHARKIHAWNASRELERWSIGGDYDKPMARRILEEAGVPRHLFGQKKMGGPEQPPPVTSARRRRLPRWLYQMRARLLEQAVLFPIGNRWHPRWQAGGFEIQHDVTTMIERYHQAMDRGAG
jgi:hypothetical protein